MKTIDGENRLGDPTELALLDLGLKFGVTKNQLENINPRVNEQAFDSERKMMTTVHHHQGEKIFAYTKGAIDQILKNCISIIEDNHVRPITTEDVARFMEASKEMSSDALRVLALAFEIDDDSADERGLTFVGLVGMIDPPRPEAKDAVAIFKGAEITTIMITGDHRDTAFAIAKELGIADSENQCISGDELNTMSQEQLNAAVPHLRVFARVSPENKVSIVKAFKSHGHIVSMTGDGVNDAPSLKTADIGVAMGITGTDVAKGAADMVLTDDNFATIEKAIEEGRNIYNNIKKSVVFLLSSNLGEIITMFVAIVAGFATPLKAIHILWVNLITDSLPGLALGVDSGDPDIMRQRPRNPKESLFAGGGIALTLMLGCVIGATTLFAFLLTPALTLMDAGVALSLENIKAALLEPTIMMKSQTFAFTVLAISQLFNAMGMRNINKSIFRYNHFDNKMMLLAFAVGFGLQIAVTEITFLEIIFGTVQLAFTEWLFLTFISTTPLWFHEIRILFRQITGAGREKK
ncbi:MAG: cation-translocating P-type ATPase [Anaerovorax sp.]